MFWVSNSHKNRTPAQRRAALPAGWVALPALLWALALGSPGHADETTAEAQARARSWSEGEFLDRYCLRCHQGRKPKAGLDLEALIEAPFDPSRETWEKVRRVLREREMPPENKRQPEEAERAGAIEVLSAALDSFDCDGAVDPGHVTLRRLNRVEYDNTVRDLLGVLSRPSEAFPADEVGHGFDNIGDVLSLPPLLLEKYLEAASAVVEEAWGRASPSASKRVEAESVTGVEHSQARGVGTLFVGREAEVPFDFEAPVDGWYSLRFRGYGEQAGPDLVRAAFRVDGKSIREIEVAAEEDTIRQYDHVFQLKAGRHRFGIAYLNNYNVQDAKNPRLNGDRNLILDWMQVSLLLPERVEAPRAGALAPQVAGIEDGRWRSAARDALADFAGRAFRRPLRGDEVDRLFALVEGVVEAGDSLEAGLRLATEAVLVSPHFLFRVELDPGALTRSPQPAGERPPAGEVKRVPLGDHALAARLSYFLWSSLPDAELQSLADRGRLRDPKVLAEQVDRLLRDLKARAFVDNFGGQWLQTRFLQSVAPDPARFPDFDEALRRSMAREPLEFLAALLRENRSVLELLDADFTYVDERLAKHYGMEGVKGESFRRVSLADSPRGGLLTQASFLTLSSNPTRTSPVKRGLWIMERILGSPPPPPPDDVPELSEEQDAILSGSLRQRMEKHRENPECNICHQKMDPLGFAFENFDAVGRWREFDGDFLVDPSGVLPDGQEFAGAPGLKKILQAERATFLRNLARQVLTYALGRGMEYPDRCAIEEIVASLEGDGLRFRTLIRAVVLSDPFRFRRAD